MSDDVVEGWYWIRKDRSLAQVVETVSLPAVKTVRLCRRGLNAAESITDALQYAPGPVACRVQVWGDVERAEGKIVGRHRKVLWTVDAERILWRHACWVAERTLLEWSGQDVADVDELSLCVVEARLGWLRGEVTDAELATALSASWNASLNSSWSTSWAAARNAARAAIMYAAVTTAIAAGHPCPPSWAEVESAAKSAIEYDLLDRVTEAHESGVTS